jgi:hypothetical protein
VHGNVHEALREKLVTARIGGAQKHRDKVKAAGQLLVRERLELLFDEGWSFEDGLLARFDEGLPGDAVVTCVGKVDGRDVAVIANDFTVKAGTWGKRTFEKITRTQEIADESGLPLVYLFDSAGARIDEQFESYAGRRAWGNIFYNQVQISGRVRRLRVRRTCPPFATTRSWCALVPPRISAPLAWPRWSRANKSPWRRWAVRRCTAAPPAWATASWRMTRRRSPRSACG